MFAFSTFGKFRGRCKTRWMWARLGIPATWLVLVSAACATSPTSTVVPPTDAALLTQAAVNAVSPCLACALRQQIQAASPGSTIEIPAGVYTLLNGELVIDKDLVLVGAGAPETIIQAAESLEVSSHRVLRVVEGVTVAISGVTIRHGAEPGTDPQMLPFLSEAVGMRHSGIAEIYAEFGGGIYNQGDLTLTDSAVSDNFAGGGGGIFNGAKVRVVDSTVSRNAVVGAGGGVFNGGIFQLVGSELADNTAGGGGGMANWGNTSISGSTIQGNHARSSGGGIYNTGVGFMELDGVTVSYNESKIGGGISNAGRIGLVNSTISGNLALISGGIDNRAYLTAHYTTISQNEANESGGLAARPVHGIGSTLASNSIIAGNRAADGPDCTGAIDSGGHNLVGVDSRCGMAVAPNDRLGNAQQPIDAGLGPLGPNGGPTHTHAPLTGSPAIDAGGTNSPPFDQTGKQRRQGAASDIGAVEIPN